MDWKDKKDIIANNIGEYATAIRRGMEMIRDDRRILALAKLGAVSLEPLHTYTSFDEKHEEGILGFQLLQTGETLVEIELPYRYKALLRETLVDLGLDTKDVQVLDSCCGPGRIREFWYQKGKPHRWWHEGPTSLVVIFTKHCLPGDTYNNNCVVEEIVEEIKDWRIACPTKEKKA